MSVLASVSDDRLRHENVVLLHGKHALQTKKPEFTQLFFTELVTIAKRPEPDPIPNSTVKRFSANGTKSQDLGE